jgi:hypothetical protein
MKRALRRSHSLQQLRHRHAKGAGQLLHHDRRGIRPDAGLDLAKVRLLEPRAAPELLLRPIPLAPESPHDRPESWCCHIERYILRR